MTYSATIQRVFVTSVMLLAATLPFGFRFPSYAIILTGAAWLLCGGYKNMVTSIKTYPSHWLFPFLFLLSVLGLVWSSHTDIGLRELETRLPLLILPLLLLTSYHRLQLEKNRILSVFVLAVLVACVVCFAHSVYLYYHEIEMVRTGEVRAAFINTNYFFASLLSWFLHPSYFGMYLCFCQIILFYFFHKQVFRFSWWLLILAQVFITVFMFFLTSKTGIVFCAGIWFGYLVYWVKRSKRYVLAGATAALIVVFVFIAARKSEMVSSRFSYLYHAMFEKKIDPSSSESNEVRLLIWNAATHVLHYHYLYGTGTGDVNKALTTEYKHRGMSGALEYQLNAHNQFLQTFLETGIAGITLLLLALILPFIRAIKSKNILMIGFVLLLFGNFLVESMLQTQAGTLFTGFFIALLPMFELKKLTAEK